MRAERADTRNGAAYSYAREERPIAIACFDLPIHIYNEFYGESNDKE